MKRKKSFENILLIGLFIFASIGAYAVFASSTSGADNHEIENSTLYVKRDFSKYNTAKPSLAKDKQVEDKE